MTPVTCTSRRCIYAQMGCFSIECIHCGAVHFPDERIGGHHQDSFGDCCNHGKVKRASNEHPKGVPMEVDFPEEQKQLFLKTHPKTKDYRFHQCIRNLNSSFALASFCATNDRTPSSGIY